MIDLPRRAATGRSPWPLDRERCTVDPPLRTAVAVLVGAVTVAAALFSGPVAGPVGIVLVGVGAAVVAVVLSSPFAALMVLLVASFVRLAAQGVLPADPAVLALGAMVVSAAVATARSTARFRFGVVEAVMLAYLAWNLGSMLMPHALPAIEASTGEAISEYRFILTGAGVPFVGYVVARTVLHGEDRVRRLMVSVVAMAAYSALVSILQFTGPAALVFPRYIIDDPSYPERAVGVVNQPLVNGMIMVAGFVTAMLLAQERRLSPGLRVLMLVAALACLPGIYLTKTRTVWLVLALALVVCALFARSSRRGFVATLLVLVAVIGINWSTFTSSDREAGGVTSTNEVDDRLNSMATALWAIEREPAFGWGIARFSMVNAEHHQVWAPDVKFERGYGIASHENELGIAAELGIGGLALWLAVVVSLAVGLLRALRVLPGTGLSGRALGLVALIAFGTWLVSGFTADLRYFDFANLIVFVFVGGAVGTAERLTRHRVPASRPASEPVGTTR